VPLTSDNPPFQRLLGVASRLQFGPHHISRLIDDKGRHQVELSAAFPFSISLFRYTEGGITSRLSWHQRLELLLPLDGVMKERMGDQVAEVGPGDILVVDNLKPHGIAEDRGMDTRAIVISFMPECVFTPGAPPADSVFLTPFQPPSDGGFRLLRADSKLAAEAHEAVARMLQSYFGSDDVHRQSGCKAWLLVLLHALTRAFRSSPEERTKVLQARTRATRIQPVLDRLQKDLGGRLPVSVAARMCGTSPVSFSRMFRLATGMTLSAYVNRLRMARAVELLERTDDTIASIALDLGFSDQSHFDRTFRRSFGHTPSAHRAGLRSAVDPGP
jgi:AraC-like DNA-binding protein